MDNPVYSVNCILSGRMDYDFNLADYQTTIMLKKDTVISIENTIEIKVDADIEIVIRQKGAGDE